MRMRISREKGAPKLDHGILTGPHHLPDPAHLMVGMPNYHQEIQGQVHVVKHIHPNGFVTPPHPARFRKRM